MIAGAPGSAPAPSANTPRRDNRAAIPHPVFCNATTAATPCRSIASHRPLMLHHPRDEQSCVDAGGPPPRPDVPRWLDRLAAGGPGGALHHRAVHRSDRLRAPSQRHRSDGVARSLSPLLHRSALRQCDGQPFRTSLIVTLACLALGYPLAYVMARRNDAVAVTFLVAVGLSFWTGFVVRTYAWLVILGNKGPVAATYALAGWGKPPQLLFTSFSSTLGMTHVLLPYMVLALYGVMRKIDPSYMRAAEGLGARPFGAFRLVFLPLSLPGVVNGCVLVFTMCLGFYITPILLGTPKDMMISQLISQQIEDLLAWGFASAIAVVLLACTLVLLGVYNRFAGLDRLWG